MALKIVHQLKQVLDAAKEGKNTVDRLSFIETVLSGIAPTIDPATDKRTPLSPSIRGIAKTLDIKLGWLKRHMKRATKHRSTILDDDNQTKFLFHHSRNRKSKYTPELVERLHQWIRSRPYIHESPAMNDKIQVKLPTTGEASSTETEELYFGLYP